MNTKILNGISVNTVDHDGAASISIEPHPRVSIEKERFIYYEGGERVGDTVQLFKRVFGRQLVCKDKRHGGYTNRWWIWTFDRNGTHLYALVGKGRGVYWEFPMEHDHDKVMDIYNDLLVYINDQPYVERWDLLARKGAFK